MAKSKAPRKKRSNKRNSITLVENVLFWKPIQSALTAGYVSKAELLVSQEYVPDSVIDAITEPIQKSKENLISGLGTFQDFWILLQTLYFYIHLLADILTQQKYRIYEYHPELGEKLNDLAVDYFLDKYKEQLSVANNQYSERIKAIRMRYAKTGKYGLSGDELTMIDDIYSNLLELLQWVSVSMVYRSILQVTKQLETVEQRIYTNKQTKIKERFKHG